MLHCTNYISFINKVMKSVLILAGILVYIARVNWSCRVQRPEPFNTIYFITV